MDWMVEDTEIEKLRERLRASEDGILRLRRELDSDLGRLATSRLAAIFERNQELRRAWNRIEELEAVIRRLSPAPEASTTPR